MTRRTDNTTSTAIRIGTRPLLMLVAATTMLSCAPLGPQPWERDLLARREMQVNSYPLQTAAEDHIYFSKEAASGGRGFAGGGCGCN